MTTQREHTMTTALYRFFDAEGVLLYVGISHRLNGRLSAHKKEKAWDEVTRITLEHYPTRDLAADAEVRAIQAEKPRWNVMHASERPHQARISQDVWSGGEESRLRYLRFRAWPDLGKFYSDMCTNCRRFSDEDLEGGTLSELMDRDYGYLRGFARGPIGAVRVETIRAQYECPRCGHIWECNYREDTPVVMNGADPAVLSWLLSLFPRGTVWDKEDVWVFV